MTTVTTFENLPDTLLRPPAHAWEGPQPGLSAQADNFCRYYFSEKNGRLDSIIHYSSDGTPDMRIFYQPTADTKKVEPCEIEVWNGTSFVRQNNGPVFYNTKLPRVMITDDGSEKKIPHDVHGIYVTPAGEIVRLESFGTLFKQPRATYLGRLQGFNALHPFNLKTPTGVEPIAIDKKDVVIDLHGSVFQFQRSGLVSIGEISEMVSGVDMLESFEIPHEYFTLQCADEKLYMDIHDRHIKEFIAGPLHKIGGKHPFIRNSVPELIDVYGGVVAEEMLRDVERRALELGLVFYAMKHELRTDVRAVFLKAQHILEEKLWNAIDMFEQRLGKSRHSIINPQDIRDWVDYAATQPHEALLQLKESAQKKYAA